MNRIHYSKEDGTKSTFMVEDQIIVGSSAKADVTIPARYVSRQHVRLEERDGHIFVTDLDSRNGTILAGQRLPPHQSYRWTPETILSIGSVQLLLEQLDEPKHLPANVDAHSVKLFLSLGEPYIIPNRDYTLNLAAITAEPQTIKITSEDLPGIHSMISPAELELNESDPGQATLRVRTRRPFFLRSEKMMRLTVCNDAGDYNGIDVVVRLPQRLGLLLAMLIVLVVSSVALIAINEEDALLPAASMTETRVTSDAMTDEDDTQVDATTAAEASQPVTNDVAMPDLGLMQLNIAQTNWSDDCERYDLAYSVRLENNGTVSSSNVGLQIVAQDEDGVATNAMLIVPPLVPGGLITLNGTLNMDARSLGEVLTLEVRLYDLASDEMNSFVDATYENNTAVETISAQPTCQQASAI